METIAVEVSPCWMLAGYLRHECRLEPVAARLSEDAARKSLLRGRLQFWLCTLAISW